MLSPWNVSQFQIVSWELALRRDEFALPIWKEAMKQRVY